MENFVCGEQSGTRTGLSTSSLVSQCSIFTHVSSEEWTMDRLALAVIWSPWHGVDQQKTFVLTLVSSWIFLISSQTNIGVIHLSERRTGPIFMLWRHTEGCPKNIASSKIAPTAEAICIFDTVVVLPVPRLIYWILYKPRLGPVVAVGLAIASDTSSYAA